MPDGPDTMDLSNTFSLVVDKVASWIQGAIVLLPNLIVATLVVLAFVALARLSRNASRRMTSAVTDNRQIRGLLSTLAYAGVLAIGIFTALSILDLQGVVTSLLAGVGIVGLALGFAFQDLAANFISGVLMAIRRPFKVGEVVETNGHMGVVEEVSLRSTRLRTFQGQEVRIPNSHVFGAPLVNYSERGERRVDLACGVAYGDDLERARAVALEAIEGLDFVRSERGVELFYREFGGSSIDFDLRFWISYGAQRDFVHARSEAIIALKKAFDDSGVTIPFPIRTLDFGVVGGEPLREHWTRDDDAGSGATPGGASG